MKFCCEDFECSYKVRKSVAPNIRVVKFTSKFLVKQKSIFSFSKKLANIRFFITLGYDEFKLDAPQMNIDFCPHCGTNLHKFYDESYANEIEGDTFNL